jgi:hypothetical protein
MRRHNGLIKLAGVGVGALKPGEQWMLEEGLRGKNGFGIDSRFGHTFATHLHNSAPPSVPLSHFMSGSSW